MRKWGLRIVVVNACLSIAIVAIFAIAAQFMNHAFFLPIFYLPIFALLTLLGVLLGVGLLVIDDVRKKTNGKDR